MRFKVLVTATWEKGNIYKDYCIYGHFGICGIFKKISVFLSAKILLVTSEKEGAAQ